MLNKIVIKNDDGSVVIETIAPQALEALNMNETDLEQFVISRKTQEGKNVVGKISEDKLPQPSATILDWELEDGLPVFKAFNDGRHFRSAWVWDDNLKEVVEDSAKVKVLRVAIARTIRDQLLKDSDLELLIAQETKSGKATKIKHYRQHLRDLGHDIDHDPTTISFPVKP